MNVSGHSYCKHSLNPDVQLLLVAAAAAGNLQQTSLNTNQGTILQMSLLIHEEEITNYIFFHNVFILLVCIHISCKNIQKRAGDSRLRC